VHIAIDSDSDDCLSHGHTYAHGLRNAAQLQTARAPPTGLGGAVIYARQVWSQDRQQMHLYFNHRMHTLALTLFSWLCKKIRYALTVSAGSLPFADLCIFGFCVLLEQGRPENGPVCTRCMYTKLRYWGDFSAYN